MISREEILRWLREEDPEALRILWDRADLVRRMSVGDAVHLRGLLEISNHCVRRCAYCGIRAGSSVERYRMTPDEILACARKATRLGYGTVVLQSGEDPGLTCDSIAETVRSIKAETPLAVTLSLGEREDAELAAWRRAGADRYLLRFETSNRALYERIHPSRNGERSDRIAILERLHAMGYEIGSGVMIGLPGQTCEDLVDDVQTFRRIGLDMIGVGPYLPHPETPLGSEALPEWDREVMTYKVVALARLVCPGANIPSTTALATVNRSTGRELGLARGANVLMPNLTPPSYREHYTIYPDKACLHETAEICSGCIRGRIESIGRSVGTGRGDARTASRSTVTTAQPATPADDSRDGNGD
jgi:biotin synthase